MKKMAVAMAGCRLEFRLDRAARVQAAVNREQVRDIGNAFASDVSSLLMQSGVDPTRRAQATAPLQGMFSSEQRIRLGKSVRTPSP